MTDSDFDSELEPGELDPSQERHLAELLRCAYAPSEIDPARHERLLLSALEDPFATATAEELVESERLRQALDGQGEHEDLALARALATAFAPGRESPPLSPELAAAPRAPSVAKPAPQRRKNNVILLRFAGGGAALAAAAAVLLSVLPSPRQQSAPELQVLALAQSRSTAPLFQADSGEAASSRIDRIASVRSRDLRDNRYALWGVR